MWATALDGWAREVRVTDTYIDLFETQTYGKLACIEMRNRVLPLGAHWVTAVQRCIDEQERVNALMEAVLARMGLPKVNPDEVAKVADTIVRFGSWIDSLAGRPIDPFQFFGNQVPSAIGRERLSKLTGHLDRMVLRLTPYAEKPPEERIDGVVGRLAELKQAYDIAVRNRDAQREALQARKELSPEAARARQEWLRIYTANKFLIEGVLRHEDKLWLKALIFDDLAEVQRSTPATELEELVTDPTADPTTQPESGDDPSSAG